MSHLSPDQRLELTQWDHFWVPPGTQVTDRPELGYRKHPEDEPHLNSVVRTRVPRARLAATVAEVLAAHRGRTSRWLVPPTLDPSALVPALQGVGYRLSAEARGCLAQVEDFVPRAGASFTVRRVRDAEGQGHALDIMNEVFKVDATPTPEARTHHLTLCTGPHARMLLFVAYDPEGVPAASGGITLYPALGLGYLFGGATREGYRGRGAYAALLAARVAEARLRGLDTVGIYANLGTSLPLVTQMGFTPHGLMSYWDRPAQ